MAESPGDTAKKSFVKLTPHQSECGEGLDWEHGGTFITDTSARSWWKHAARDGKEVKLIKIMLWILATYPVTTGAIFRITHPLYEKKVQQSRDPSHSPTAKPTAQQKKQTGRKKGEKEGEVWPGTAVGRGGRREREGRRPEGRRQNNRRGKVTRSRENRKTLTTDMSAGSQFVSRDEGAASQLSQGNHTVTRFPRLIEQ